MRRSIASKRGTIVYEVMQNIFDSYNVVLTSRPNSLTADFERKFNRKLENTGLTQSGSVEYIRKYFSKQKEIAGSALQIEESLFESLNKINSLNRTKAVECIKKYFNGQETVGNNLQIERSLLGLLNNDQNTGKLTTKDIIRQYFALQKEIADNAEKVETTLIKLLDSNPSLSESVKTPLNAALICLICSDPDSVEKFSKEFNAGFLYQEAIMWLGKRYLNKFQEKIIDNIIHATVFNLGQVITLEELAYRMFKEMQISIDGESIEECAQGHNTEIIEVNKFGLLRPESMAGSQYNERNLIGCNHGFIHLSFQEYLNAYQLKEQLINQDETKVRAAAEIIATNRNEPRWQMTLKFLSGILVNEKCETGTKKAKEERKQAINKAVQIFWEAIACNVDGSLELAVEGKITLFMHLLAQSKVDGEFDRRIPNLDTITNLVDRTIIDNLVIWSEVIIASNYMSEAIMQTIFATINEACEKAVKQEQETVAPSTFERRESVLEVDSINQTAKLKTAMKLVQYLLPRLTDNELESVLAKMRDLFEKSTDVAVKQSCITITSDIVKKTKTLNKVIKKEVVDKLIDLLKDENYRKVAQNAISEIAASSDFNIQQEILNQVALLIKSSNGDVRWSATEVIGNVVEKSGDVEVAKAAFEVSTPYLKGENKDVRSSSMEALIKVVEKSGDAGVAKAAVDAIAPCIEDENQHVKSSLAMGALVKVVEKSQNVMVERFAVDAIAPFLKHWSSYVKILAMDALVKVVEKSGDVEVAKAAFDAIVPYLQDENKDVKSSSIKALGSVGAKAGDAGVARDIFDEILPFLKDENEYLRRSVIEALGSVVEKAGDVKIAKAVFDAISPFLKDENEYLRRLVIEALGRVVKKAGDVKVARAAFDAITPCLKDKSEDVRRSVIDYLYNVVKKSGDTEVARIAIDAIISRLKDKHYNVRCSALNYLGKVGAEIDDAQVAQTLFNAITPYLNDDNEEVRSTAPYALGRVVEKTRDVGLLRAAVDLITPYLNDKIKRRSALRALSYVGAKAGDAGIARAAIDAITPFLNDEDRFVSWPARDDLFYVIEQSGDAGGVRAAFDAILHCLKDKNVKFLTIDTLGSVVEKSGDAGIARAAIDAILPFLKNKNEGLRRSAIEVLGSAVVGAGDTGVAKTTIDEILPFLKDENAEIRKSAIKVLGQIIKKSPIDQSILFLQHNVLFIRETTILHLTNFLNTRLIVKDLQLVEQIIRGIIAFESEDGERKELIRVAKAALTKQQEYIDEETLSWATEKFHSLFNPFEASKPFLKAIYHKALTDEVISKSSKFILECIKHGLTTSIIQEPSTRNYKLIFEDKTYIFEGAENSKYIEQIAEEILQQQNNQLAESYRRYQPLFPNSGVGLAKSALDISYAASLVAGASLTRDEWQLTLTQESTNTFLLLERRDVFGNHVIYKINKDLTIEHPEACHPNKVTTEFRETLFGKMEYRADSYQLYQVSTATLQHAQEFFEMVEKSRSAGDRLADVTAGIAFGASRIHYKEDLLALKDAALREAQNHRKLLDESGKVANIDKRLGELEDKFMHDAEILSTVIAAEQMKAGEKQILNKIYQNPYSRTCYETLRMQLNAVYLAANTISSGMIKNQKTGTIGSVGGILTAVSAHVPLVGAGVAFLGSLFTAYDQIVENKKIDIYAKLVLDSTQMNILSQKIALKLTTEYQLSGHVRKSMTKELFDGIKQAHDSYVATNKLAKLSVNDLPKLIVTGFQKLGDVINNALNKDKEEKQRNEVEEKAEQDGEKDAVLLTGIILSAIYKDETLANEIEGCKKAVAIDEERTLAIADLVVRYLEEHCHLVRIDENSEELLSDEFDGNEQKSFVKVVASNSPTTIIEHASPSRNDSKASSRTASKSDVESNKKASSCCVML